MNLFKVWFLRTILSKTFQEVSDVLNLCSLQQCLKFQKLHEFGILLKVHSTTNKKPKLKYASYIFFSQKTKTLFYVSQSQQSKKSDKKDPLPLILDFPFRSSHFIFQESGRRLLPGRKDDKFQSHTKTECSSICYFGEGEGVVG